MMRALAKYNEKNLSALAITELTLPRGCLLFSCSPHESDEMGPVTLSRHAEDCRPRYMGLPPPVTSNLS
jgi:hypothetical protein